MSAFMPGRRRREAEDGTPSAEIGKTLLLSDVVAGLLRAFVRAWGTMDSASSELAKEYWADPVLRSLPLPAFTIPQVTVRLKIAVAELGARGEGATPSDDVRVLVGWTELRHVPEHLISEVEFNLEPQAVSGFEHAEEGVPSARS